MTVTVTRLADAALADKIEALLRRIEVADAWCPSGAGGRWCIADPRLLLVAPMARRVEWVLRAIEADSIDLVCPHR